MSTIDTDIISQQSTSDAERRRRERRKRREERRNKNVARSKMYSFVNGAKEVASIIEKLNDSRNINYEEVAESIRLNNEKIDKLKNVILEGSESVTDESLLRMSIATSGIISSNLSSSEMESLVKVIRDNSVQSSIVIESLESGMFSNDAIVNIQLQLIPPVSQFSKSISTFIPNNKTVNEIVSWATHCAIELAKDIAFNWDKRSAYRDRETLFVMMLPTCLSICESAFFEHITRPVNRSLLYNVECDLGDLFPQLSDTLDEMDMGYATSDDVQMKKLKFRLNSIMNNAIPTAHLPKHLSEFENKIFTLSINMLDKMSAESWGEAANNMIDKIKAEVEYLDEREAQDLIDRKYSDPMPLKCFTDIFEQKIETWEGPIKLGDLSIEELTSLSHKKMASLWGLTEALCQIRSKS